MQIPARLHTFFFAVIFSVLFTLIPSTVFASHDTNPSHIQNTNPNVPANQHTMAQTVLLEVTTAIICQMTGIDMTNPNQPCLGIDSSTNKIGYPKEQTGPQIGGAIGQVVGLMSATYNIPVHVGDYTSHMAENFGVTKKVYAQGQGFENLRPILKLWERIRNIVYLAFVVIFVVIGLGIMLRLKIDPRTTMNIQNQIPKIIVSLLLITLSYPIAGALIDVMWTTTYVGINVLTDPAVSPECPEIGTAATNNLLENPLAFFPSLISIQQCDTQWGIAELSWTIGTTFGDIVARAILGVLGINQNFGECSFNPATWSSCAKTTFFGIVSVFITALGALVILFAIYIQLIRVWFSLIKAYVTFIFYAMIGPLWIFLGLIPGAQSFGFGQWMRRLLAPLAAFPLTAFLFILGAVIANNPEGGTPGASPFIPPLIGNPNIQDNLGYLFALGVILLAPEAVGMARAAFKAPDSTYLPKIMAGLGAGAGMAAPVGKYLFGKGKDGRWGPGSYYGKRVLGGVVNKIPYASKIIDRVDRTWSNLKYRNQPVSNYNANSGQPLTNAQKYEQRQAERNAPKSGNTGGTTTP